ncbi:amidophosphoribosyltransferase [Candidatus Poribacteria bacterium]|nr:amidophosphoribosyltransferase [Candidatus Poribacteria bacterium]
MDSSPLRLLSARPHDECGVCAVAGDAEAANLVYLGLIALQHRGHETAGIVSVDSGGAHLFRRGAGLAADVFQEEDLRRLQGDTAVGHVRYSTTGRATAATTQPLAMTLAGVPTALAHNGNLTNARELRAELEHLGSAFHTPVDSEVLLQLVARSKETCFEDALAAALAHIEGAYSLVLLHGRVLYAIRDPRGFRPLALGRMPSGAWVAASESVAIDVLGGKFLRDIRPGEVLRITPGEEPVSLPLLEQAAHAHCIFELIYFSRPGSVVDGRQVHQVRERLGAELWHEEPAAAEVVIGVPETSLSAAIGFAAAARLPFGIGLIRNRHVGRTFIEPHQTIRHLRAKIKYSPVASVIEGRRIAVIDDSIVRGTTSRRIVALLRHEGAAEEHLRITAPPWRHPCHYGIDTPDEGHLLAAPRTIEQMRVWIGCDSLGFLSPEGLHRAVGTAHGWCDACFSGTYPHHAHLVEQTLAGQHDVR